MHMCIWLTKIDSVKCWCYAGFLCIYVHLCIWQVTTIDGMTIRGLISGASLILRRKLHVTSRSKTNIKPASPTPLKLKQYNLPSHDRMVPNTYLPIIFFYSNPQLLDNKPTISSLLKNSLSKTLGKYYPFAGRLRSAESYVRCNDKGIDFVEARIACKLSEVLEKAPSQDDEEGYGHLFPPCSIWQSLVLHSCLMVVQLNHFSCGGIAIAVSLSHRLGDGSTLLSFLSYWANLSRNSSDEEKLVHLRPCFMNDLLPQSYDDDDDDDDDDLVATQVLDPGKRKQWITTEIVFQNSKIAQLKADQEMQDKLDGVAADQNYSRNELVTALLYRCVVVAAAATSNSGAYPKSVLMQPVNVRPLFDPPLPKTTVGNLIAYNFIPTSETKLNSLVRQMRKRKMQLRGIKSLDGQEFMSLVVKYAKTNHKLYAISSICNFPLYEEMDFGWGRPVKATIVDFPNANCFVMMDTPSGDGIKVTLGLEEENMKNFKADKELLNYTSF